MSFDYIFICLVFVLMTAAFLSGRTPVDLTSLVVLAVFLVMGYLTPEQAFSGFASSAVIIMITTRILGGALERTGVADAMGGWITRASGATEWHAIALLMFVSALFSAFLPNIVAVALLLPSALIVSQRKKIAPSRLLIPLSFGAILGGMLTLIGSPPNIIASDLLVAKGLEPFHFFSFTPFGLAAVAIGVLLFGYFESRLLPVIGLGSNTQSEPLAEVYRLNERLFKLRIPEGSPLAEHTLQSAQFSGVIGGRVLAIIREGVQNASPLAHDILKADDRLILCGRKEDIESSMNGRLEMEQGEVKLELESPMLAVVEAVVAPRSALEGRTLGETKFRERYDFSVLAVWREGQPLRSRLAELKLKVGDALLMQGPRAKLSILNSDDALVIISETVESVRRKERAPLAIAAFVMMLLLCITGWQPPHVAAFLAALVVLIGGAVRMEEAYRDIEWRIVALVAALIPLGAVIERVGITGNFVQLLNEYAAGHGILFILCVFGLLSSLISQVLDGPVAVILLAPFAFEAAAQFGFDPRMIMMMIALGSSVAFLTPFSHKASLLVMGAAGYKPRDFLLPGAILSALVFVAFLILVPLIIR